MKVNIKEACFTGILLEFSGANKLGCKVCKNINSRDNDYLFAVLERREEKENVHKTRCCSANNMRACALNNQQNAHK